MKIEHLGIWVADLELMKSFYEKYFQAKAGPLYHNPVKNFSSYFLSFPEGDTRIELMYQPQVAITAQEKGHTQGLAHLAISLGNREEVRQKTELLRNEGYLIAGEPRQTGDGYYESVILDPEKNVIEICSD